MNTDKEKIEFQTELLTDIKDLNNKLNQGKSLTDNDFVSLLLSSILEEEN